MGFRGYPLNPINLMGYFGNQTPLKWRKKWCKKWTKKWLKKWLKK